MQQGYTKLFLRQIAQLQAPVGKVRLCIVGSQNLSQHNVGDNALMLCGNGLQGLVGLRPTESCQSV